MTETLQALQTYGGWAVTFFVSCWFLKFYGDTRATVADKDKQIQTINDRLQETHSQHQTEMVAVVRECTGVLTVVNESLDRCHRKI